MTLLLQMYPHQGTGYVCKLFGKSRQAWHESFRRSTAQEMADIVVIKLVEEIRAELPRLGTRKLLHLLAPKLEAHHIGIGRDRLYRLLSGQGLLLRHRRRNPHTTNSRHQFRKYPNLIREMVLTCPGQLWVSDITYLRLKEGFCYLSIVTDAYSHKIIGHCLYHDLSRYGPMEALRQANQSKKSLSVIHHSDRGLQYCCADYTQYLGLHRIQISMTEKGDPYENAIAERVNGILKGEFGLDQTFPTLGQAKTSVTKAVDRYNHLRPHASCDYHTPAMAHDMNGLLRRRWKNKVYRQEQPVGQIQE